MSIGTCINVTDTKTPAVISDCNSSQHVKQYVRRSRYKRQIACRYQLVRSGRSTSFTSMGTSNDDSVAVPTLPSMNKGQVSSDAPSISKISAYFRTSRPDQPTEDSN